MTKKDTDEREIAEVECETLVPLPARGGHAKRVEASAAVKVTHEGWCVVVASREDATDAVCVPITSVRWWRWR